MELKFERASLEYTYNSITNFFDETQSREFQEYICSIYTTFDIEKIRKMSFEEKLIYIRQEIEPLYNSKVDIMNEKVNEYQNEWDEIDDEVFKGFQSIFNIDINNDFKKFTVQVGLNPVCPRYLSEYKFDCFYKFNTQSAIENTIHELIHFIWFKVWEQVFPDFNRELFEYPSIIWMFSEIAIDPILRDSRLKKYCTLEKPAYNYFYDIKINDKSFIETIRNLYSKNDMEKFMVKGLKYCESYKETLMEFI